MKHAEEIVVIASENKDGAIREGGGGEPDKEPVLTTEGTMRPKARNLAYFSLLTDAETFGQLATIATHRQGTERAGTVCAVMDGAEWLQGFIDLHCPTAAPEPDRCL